MGIVLTLAVVAADAYGLLNRFERYLYDERVLHFQFFMPPPTDRLVHLDIDDAALESIGRWPWDRSVLAKVLDELTNVKPAAVALDLLLTEPQTVSWTPNANGTFDRVDGDQALAAALKRLGNTLVPASFGLDVGASSPLFVATRALLVQDLEQDEVRLADSLFKSGHFTQNQIGELSSVFLLARRSAMFHRIKAELIALPAREAEVRRRVLPHQPAGVVSPLTRLFGEQFTRATAAVELERRSVPVPPGATPSLYDADLALAPIQPLEQSAATTAFVNYPHSKDERVRSVPLMIESDGRAYPQLGLSLACATLGVPLDKLRVTPQGITIPAPGGPARFIPTRTLQTYELQDVKGAMPLAIDIPWFGPQDWESMYSAPGTPRGAQHVPIVSVWDVCGTRDRIDENDTQADGALKAMYAAYGDKDKIAEFEAHRLDAGDWRARVERVNAALADLKDFIPDLIAATTQPSTDDLERQKDRVVTASYTALEQFTQQAADLGKQLDLQRQVLRAKLQNKAVIIGWTASSSIADFVSTPLHNRCPGPVVHGVVFNAIMTGELWRAAPQWWRVVVTVALGLLMAVAVSRFPPPTALLVAVLIALLYVIVNGALLFDYGNIILGMAGPLTVIAAVWSGGTLTQLIGEQRQRALIRRRFRTYVDPQLVDFVEKHPQRASFQGERREMTVVFTDIVGFTSLTEAMGEKTVTLLNELWARVVPVVRRSGYLNKFLGDGIMFFYNAPAYNGQHARDAVDTALELAVVMQVFYEEVTSKRGLPTLGMRIGVSTGDMIVGDAGAGEAGSDYTVLGDNVNLGARLEGANKTFGTANLMTARTAEMASDTFLFRPIASLRVVGKAKPVDVCEAVCRLDRATDQQRELVRLSQAMVDCYRSKRLEDCLAAAAALDALVGPNLLTEVYRDAIEDFNARPEPKAFDPSITLTSK